MTICLHSYGILHRWIFTITFASTQQRLLWTLMVTHWQFPFVAHQDHLASDHPALQHSKLSPSSLLGSSSQSIRCKGTHWVFWHVADSKIIVTVGRFGRHEGITVGIKWPHIHAETQQFAVRELSKDLAVRSLCH